MTHVTAYIRISTDKQTLDNQRSEILRFAQGHGLEIDNWIEEIVSGKVKERDRKLGRFLKKMKRGDILIVSELSRLSRTLLEIMTIMQKILEKGVILYSVKENCCLGDNINSKVILFAFGLAAEIERDLISARTREALAVRKEQGAVLGRQPGSCPKMGKLMVEKEEILRRRNAGMSITDLSKAYNVSRGTMSKFIGSHV